MVGIFIAALVQTALQSCNSNPLRTIYTGDSFTLASTPEANSNYSYLINYLGTKVTSFSSQSPTSDNWCTNSSDIFSTAQTEFCCSTSDINKMAWQFAAKYIMGASNFLVNSVSVLNMYIKTCVMVDNANYTRLKDILTNQTFSRSLWGIYFAVYKAVMAAQPVSQTFTCLICANDNTIPSYVSANNVLLLTSAFDTMVESFATAIFDYNNAYQSLAKMFIQIYKAHLIDFTKSPATCTTQVNNAAYNIRFCYTKENCTALSKMTLSNTCLEFQSLGTYISNKNNNPPTRVLRSRVLATVTSSSGAGASKFSGITSSVKVNGADGKTLEKSFSSLLMVSLLALSFA